MAGGLCVWGMAGKRHESIINNKGVGAAAIARDQSRTRHRYGSDTGALGTRICVEASRPGTKRRSLELQAWAFPNASDALAILAGACRLSYIAPHVSIYSS